MMIKDMSEGGRGKRRQQKTKTLRKEGRAERKTTRTKKQQKTKERRTRLTAEW